MPPFELREALRYMGVRGEPTTELMQLAQRGRDAADQSSELSLAKRAAAAAWGRQRPAAG